MFSGLWTEIQICYLFISLYCFVQNATLGHTKLSKYLHLFSTTPQFLDTELLTFGACYTGSTYIFTIP